ncbi:MAG TPA: FAD-dependent oxidoreductase [Gemmatales bacterium]|nr:FAD-dependent oxidoreductase [Gemmatales bacterium]HMP59974.1 FAD-dependent oxidoreductase [Gemmatales bacterium]
MNVDVIIVGAGIAGLAAARQLVDQGRSVMVLEAQERVGGRLLSTQVAGARLDLGGQWLGPRQPRLARLAQELGVATYPQHHAGIKLLSWQGRIRRFRGEVPWLSPLALFELWRLERRLNRMQTLVPPDAPWEAPHAAEWDGQSLETWKRKQLWSKGSRLFVDLVTRAVITSEPCDVSLLYFLTYLRSGTGLRHLISIPDGAQESRFQGGAQQLAERLADQLGDRVKLRSPVRAVRQSLSTSEVVTDAGERWLARRVIVALPPLLAGRIYYDPALPVRREQLTARMPMGSVIKYVAAFARPFWREAGLSGEAFCDAGPATTTFDDSDPGSGQAALVGFSDGAAARHWGEWGPNERRQAVLGEWVRLFGREAAQPLDFVEKNWCADSWSRGCYAGVAGPGVLTAWGPALREPCGRVHWAGTETATEWLGYIEGALQSAERVVTEVVAALTVDASAPSA